MNDTLAGWTIPDLPDNCTSALSVYCSPSSGATMPQTTTFLTTCSPAYWENLLSATSTANATTTTPGGPPGPAQTGVAANCDAWYVVQANDNCQAIVAKFGNFTLVQFYSWNPAVGSSCSYLIPTDAVCIGVSGGSATSSSHSSSSSSHMTTTTAPSPLLPSTDPSFTSYYYVMPGDNCDNIEQTYKISADEYICVGAPYTSSSAKPSSTTHTTSASPTVPSPLEPSTDPQCTTYHYVVTGDTCAALESTYEITAAQFNRWNPFVGTGCANLWLNSYVCVGAPN
ncbi:hypothetical protein B0T26DRAFT_775514 [Lasiosphaeria miniovina]|uniref:LysM domain-containing protein n=1 Tax=Lasiosphaeria miniovina TaxID=1954250 RepID=A0AA40AK76_9PEZI|nr:uncharacterized protein B0T26DRAFT_775514 [Lasiosphaeria miniovina]KAK0717314.1 hypothetical protein B0T26DRAFT_775514 [Lasiosphaeria miniovina]